MKTVKKNKINQKPISSETRTANGFTHAQEARMIREAKDALKNGKRYKSYKELHDDILKD